MGTLVRVALLICHLTVAHTETCSYEVSLPAIYSYQEVPLPSVNVSNSLVLEVKACMDAHLAISNSLDLSKDMFEFVFGAGSNTICSIRSCRQFCQITKTFDRTLSCNEFRKVWIAWGPPGVRLGVGGKADNNTLLTTTCGASLTVHHVWISMYETTSGDWRVDCTYNETSASTKSDLAKSTATPTPTAQNTTQSSMQETTTSAASSPSPNTSRYFCEQVRQSSIEMTAEKIVKELRLKEQTSARRRQLETTSDHRASAQLMGLTAVAVLVTVALAVIIPDLIALFVWTTVKLQMVKKQGLKTSRLSPEVIPTEIALSEFSVVAGSHPDFPNAHR